MGERYARAGLGRAPHEPAAAWAARIGPRLNDGGAALLPLILRFDNWRYAPHPGGRIAAGALAGSLRRHRPQALERRASADAPIRRPT
jgi:hypothetical protein